METTTDKRESRWKRTRGTKVTLVEHDLDLFKLLTPYAKVRDPWSYMYLPAHYFAPLLQRGPNHTPKRVGELSNAGYLELPDQPRNNFRHRIFRLDSKGADVVRDDGYQFVVRPKEAVAHELGACLVAASFELGARKYNLPIQTVPYPKISKHPDWPVFTLAGHTVLIEFDTGTQSQEVIEQKYDVYLQMIDDKLLRKPLIIFVTARRHRLENLIDNLKRVVDSRNYPYSHASHFLFAHMEYDRFLNKLPKPSDWAVSSEYRRATNQPFSFLNHR